MKLLRILLLALLIGTLGTSLVAVAADDCGENEECCTPIGECAGDDCAACTCAAERNPAQVRAIVAALPPLGSTPTLTSLVFSLPPPTATDILHVPKAA